MNFQERGFRVFTLVKWDRRREAWDIIETRRLSFLGKEEGLEVTIYRVLTKMNLKINK